MTRAVEAPVVVSRTGVRLARVVAALMVVAAGVGLFWSGGTAPEVATTVRGEQVALYGTGLYRYDSLHVGPVHRGTDLVALTVWLPLLVWSTASYRRGSLRGALLLTSALLWTLYLYLSLALAAAYNQLFLVYVILVATSGTALVLVARSIDPVTLARGLAPSFPRVGLSAFLVAVATGTVGLWGGIAVAAAVSGQPPAHLQLATTTVEEALSLGLLVPALLLAAACLGRHDLGTGILLGFPLLTLVAGLAPVVSAQTAAQVLAGVDVDVGSLVALVATWVVLGLIAVAFVVRTLRSITEPDSASTRSDARVGT